MTIDWNRNKLQHIVCLLCCRRRWKCSVPLHDFLSITLLFTVRETRAPMGTKATPTVSLSTIMSVGIHNVDARLPWCQLLHFKQPGRPYIFNWHLSQKKKKRKRHESDVLTLPRLIVMDWGKVATETLLSSRGGCPPDLMNWWTFISDEHFLCVGGKGTEGETWRREEMRWFSRNIVMMILTSLKSPEERVSPHGAPWQMRNLDISVCVRVATLGFFL